jgi:hypothetical protein
VKGVGYLRITAVVLALLLTLVLVAPGTLGVSGELPTWLLFVPLLLLVTASVLASRARSANIRNDGEDNTPDQDAR